MNIKKRVVTVLSAIFFLVGCGKSEKGQVEEEPNEQNIEGEVLQYGGLDSRKVVVDSFSEAEDGTLVVELGKSVNRRPLEWRNTYIKLEDNNWSFMEENPKLLNEDNISYNNNQVKVMQRQELVFEDTLPILEEISEALDIEFPNSDIRYTAFRVEKNFAWDKKTHIASIGINKYVKYRIDYEKVFYISLLKQNTGEWNIGLIKVLDRVGGVEPSDYDLLDSPNDHESRKLSTDKKASFCLKYKYCFVQEDDKIVSKKLFGDLYPEEYFHIIDKYEDDRPYIGSTHVTPIFDKDNNMHLFYNDLDNLDTKPFNYLMFSPDSLETPVNALEIKWKE